uniref:Putative lipocalin-3 1 n=1 Tax=Amblyomma cajennense TaxID=34607 RepID=A0A023FQM5_AMBCJ
MAAHMVLQAAAFGLLAAMVVASSGANEENYDFKELLTEGKVLWVFNTTEPGSVSCRKDSILTVKDVAVTFERSFKNNSIVRKENLTGKLINWYIEVSPKYYDTLEINDTQGELETQEILEYLNEEKTCAVVKVMKVKEYSDGTTGIWRDLRLSNDAVEQAVPPECFQKFEQAIQFSKTRPRTAYDSGCRGSA